MKTKLNKSENTKQYIIEKAAIVFNKKGYAGASMSELTKEIGLTKGAIYGNFKNKDEIAFAAFDYNAGKLIKKLRFFINQKESAIEKLLAFNESFLKIYEENYLTGGCPILNTAVDSGDTHPELGKRVNIVIAGWNNMIINIINEGKKNDEIHESIDAEKYASIFISLTEGGSLLSKTMGDKRYISNSLDHIKFLINYKLKK